MKTCRKCLELKPASAFCKNSRNSDGLQGYCKFCVASYNLERLRENPELQSKYNRSNYLRHREQRIANACAYQKIYIVKNRARVRAARRKRYRTNINARMSANIRRRILDALKGRSKSESTIHLLGCSILQLRAHLEAQFRDGMTWDNYGKWHIDHRKACSRFDLSDPEAQSKCFHFSNLQPLWAYENVRKHNH